MSRSHLVFSAFLLLPTATYSQISTEPAQSIQIVPSPSAIPIASPATAPAAPSCEPAQVGAPYRADNAHSRPGIVGDYLVIEYDACRHEAGWHDYHRWPDMKKSDEAANSISRNGSFLPVIYTREKVAVHVYNLRFTDQLIVTTSGNPLSEGGADIRGTTPVTLTPLTSTLDALQLSTVTGGPTSVSGLGFGTTGALTVSALSGFTVPKNADRSDAVLPAISGDQLALMRAAMIANSQALVREISDMWKGQPQPDQQPVGFLPGSVGYLTAESTRLEGKVRLDASNKSAAAAFDQDMTQVQNLAAALSMLSSSLSTKAFGSRAVVLQNNYATIQGILDLTGHTNPAGLNNAALSEFNAAYDARLHLLYPDPAQFKLANDWTPANVFTALRQLRDKLDAIDTNSGTVFTELNRWYDESSVEQTDMISPPATNAIMRLSIVVQRGYTPFILVSGTATAPAAPAAPPAASTSTPAHSVITLLFEVHRLANFNLAGGVMVIHVPTSTFNITPAINGSVASLTATAIGGVTTVMGGTTTTTGVSTSIPGGGQTITGGVTTNTGGILTNTGGTVTSSTNYQGSCGGSATPSPTPANAATYSCIIATQQTSWQVAGMVGLTWYPMGRDYFPRSRGFTNYPRNYIPGVLIATSVTSFGSAFGGLNFEPLTGIDFFAGIASANRNVLPNGVTAATLVPTNYTVQNATQVHAGFAAGLAFDLGVFTQLFSKGAPTGGLP
jgi:hypothetical protein